MKKRILLVMGVCFLLLCGCAGQPAKAPSAGEGELFHCGGESGCGSQKLLFKFL